jgi:hypoxia up-regulated 1
MRVLGLLVIAAVCIASVYSAAALAIDFGTEWMKVAIVRPGKMKPGMERWEIVLSKESKRKSPTVIVVRNTVRIFGIEATSIVITNIQFNSGYKISKRYL